MSTNLLKNEEVFRKMNEEEESRNKKLMEEYDILLKKQDFLLKETLLNNVDYCEVLKKRCMGDADELSNRMSNVPKQIQQKDNSDINSCLNIPDSVDQMGAKGIAHFYKAKIKGILSENQKFQRDYKIKCDDFKNLQRQNTKLAEEKDKWLQAFNCYKLNNHKLESQVELFDQKLQTTENENRSLKKEIEELKKDLKNQSLNITNVELKLNRALEENDKMKNILKLAKQEEKDFKEAHRIEIAEITSNVKKIEKQKSELLSAFKKQMQLIDNLKKQKTYLETLKLTQISEREFIKLLEVNEDSKCVP